MSDEKKPSSRRGMVKFSGLVERIQQKEGDSDVGRHEAIGPATQAAPVRGAADAPPPRGDIDEATKGSSSAAGPVEALPSEHATPTRRVLPVEMTWQTLPPYEFDWSPNDRYRVEIPLDRVEDSPYQPRLIYDESQIAELARSIEAQGLQEEIQVRIIGNGRFQALGGHRRRRACEMAGKTSAHMIVRKCSDIEAEVAVLTQADSGVDLCDFERALMYQRTLDHKLAKDQVEVAAMYEKSTAWISNILKLLKLPPGVIEFLRMRPRMLSNRGAKQILQLRDQYLSSVNAKEFEEIVLEALAKALDQGGAEKCQDNSVIGKVGSLLQKRTGAGAQGGPAEVLVTDTQGKPLFRVVRKKKSVEITGVNGTPLSDEAFQAVREALTAFQAAKAAE